MSKFKGTREVIDTFREQGYTINYDWLRWLMRARHFEEPEKVLTVWVWEKDDISRLRKVLNKRGKGPKGNR